MKILCVFGRHAYGDRARGEAYEYVNFLPALRALGHEVEHFESFDRSVWRDFGDLNRAFLARVREFGPHVVFCVLMHYELWLETLAAVRASTPAAILHWGTDDSWKFEQFSRFIAPHVDLHATTSHEAFFRAQALGLDNVRLTQWGVASSRLAAPRSAAECVRQVSFVGSAYGNRRRWVRALTSRGIKVECFGHGWPAGPVASQDVDRIARESVLSLNFGDSGLHWQGGRITRTRQIKARLFEVPGAGGCLLTEDAPHLREYLEPDREVVVFRDPDMLAARIRELLADPQQRDAIADAGQRRVAQEHVYERRLAPLLDEALRRARKRSAAHIELAVDIERWCDEHRPGWLLRLLRLCLIVSASLLFGRARGARAARRLLHEVSWRLVGPVTYGRRGLPGRLFYRES